MGYTALNVTAPHATAYDSDYPTRSNENYAHNLHEILQDMEDATGTWTLTDSWLSTADRNTHVGNLFAMIEDVFDYAEGAIDTYRSSGTPTLAVPTSTTVQNPQNWRYKWLFEREAQTYLECTKVVFFIYYMWKTEEDPLLLKEKLQELLIAWPLLDTTIELQNDMGQSFKVYPSWKNADLDL